MRRLFPFALLLAVPANAATFLVPTDEAMTRAARAIVRATPIDSRRQFTPRGWIETVTTMRIDEAIKGPLTAGQSIEVTEVGGTIGDIVDMMPGSPQYENGSHLLLFLDRNERGGWQAYGMAVGAFVAVDGLLLRDAGEIFGWDAGTGAAHHERVRDEEMFLRYVRDVVAGSSPSEDYFVTAAHATALVPHGDAGPSIASYMEQASGQAFRRNTFPVSFFSNGAQSGIADGGIGALQRGLSTWTRANGSSVALQYGGATSTLPAADGVNVVKFNDSSIRLPTLAQTNTLAQGTHSFGGETFITIFDTDIVVLNGLSGAGLNGPGFEHTIAHEIGHCIGFRHSDRTPDDFSGCGPPLSCSTTALMNSTVDFNNDRSGAALQAWDLEAVGFAYGSGTPPPPPCNPPQITRQPPSINFAGADVVLSVETTGDAPRFQWYFGARGNTAETVPNGTGNSITVHPNVTTLYWVRVSNSCGSVDSDTATVTVNGCGAVLLDSVSASTQIIQGRTTTLTAAATSNSPLTYQWFIGTPGVTSSPAGTGQSITVQPQVTTTYWVRASNSCGAFADSDVVVVTVKPCTPPSILVQPIGGDVLTNTSVSLFVADNGTAPKTYQWFEGSRGDTSRQVNNAATAAFTTPPVFASTSFWVRITNDCGTIDSQAATLNVVSSCRQPVIVSQPQDQSVAAGASAILTVAATGTSITYQWYEGQVFDFTNPVGGSSPTLVTPPITTTAQFWARVVTPCGTVNSVAVTVTPGRRRPSHR